MNTEGRSKFSWAGTFELYATKFAHRHVWRVSRTHDVEDIVSEAYLVFLNIIDKYPAIDNERHLMGMFKRGLAWRMHDLATHHTRTSSSLSDSSYEGMNDYTQDAESSFAGEDEIHAAALLSDVPKGLEAVVAAIAPEGPRGAIVPLDRTVRGRPRTSRRETTNTMLCRVAGVSPSERDLRTLAENWLGV